MQEQGGRSSALRRLGCVKVRCSGRLATAPVARTLLTLGHLGTDRIGELVEVQCLNIERALVGHGTNTRRAKAQVLANSSFDPRLSDDGAAAAKCLAQAGWVAAARIGCVQSGPHFIRGWTRAA